MKEYHKIQTVFMRDLENRYKTLLEGQFSLPEFEYLANNEWAFTEKVDGCLHYTQPVLTDIGTIPVGRIVEKRLPVKILSWNVEKQVVEYKDILHYHKEKLVRPFLSVTVKSRGKSNRPKHIICTDNHKFYSNDAWIEAKDLKAGD